MVYPNDITVATFKNAGLSEKQAEVQALRMQDLTHEEIARALQMEKGTVKSHANRVDQKLESGDVSLLPGVSKIETTARVGEREQPAVVIWFDNETALRYVWNDDRGEIEEQTYNQGVVHDAYTVGGERDELAEYALESLAEYLNVYRDDAEACRRDWPSIFEGLTAIEA